MSIVQHVSILPLEVNCSWKCDYECQRMGSGVAEQFRPQCYWKWLTSEVRDIPFASRFVPAWQLYVLNNLKAFHCLLTATEWTVLNSSTILVCSRWFICISVIIVEPSLDNYNMVQFSVKVASYRLFMCMAECCAKCKLFRHREVRGTELYLFSWKARSHEQVGWLLHDVVR